MSEAVAVSPGRETTEVSPSKNLSNVSINSPDKDAGQSKEATKDKDEDQSEPQEDQSIQVTEKVEDPLTTSKRQIDEEGDNKATVKRQKVDPEATGFAAVAQTSMNSFATFFDDSEKKSTTGFGFGGGFGTTTASHFGTSTNTAAVTAAVIANGEEDEEKLYEFRCKLYQLRENSWIECGLGPLRILQSKTDSSLCRVVVRRESYANGPGTKLLLNRRLSACTAVQSVDEKNIRLCSVDVVDEKTTAETHLLRLNEEHAFVLFDFLNSRVSSLPKTEK